MIEHIATNAPLMIAFAIFWVGLITTIMFNEK